MGPIAGDLECFLTVTPGPMVPTEGLTVCSQGMPEDTVGGGPPPPPPSMLLNSRAPQGPHLELAGGGAGVDC